MLPIIIIVSVGLGVTAFIGGVAFALRPTHDNLAEDRLSILTGTKRRAKANSRRKPVYFRQILWTTVCPWRTPCWRASATCGD